MAEKPQVKVVPEVTTDAPQSIAKPEGFDLNKFKSKRANAIAKRRDVGDGATGP